MSKPVFNEFFDRISVIHISKNTERKIRLEKELKEKNLADTKSIHWQEAVYGAELKPSAWWKAGGGAWGCLWSHVLAMQKAYNDGVERLLLIEDDTIFTDDTEHRLPLLMKELPSTFGQFYLGGQHQHTPKYVTDSLVIGKSINRTHCFAVTKQSIPKILKHVLNYDININNIGKPLHIDHQLEVAHQRAQWEVYCPRWWLAGQGSNNSDINGKEHPNMWWETSIKEQHRELPLLVSTSIELSEAAKKFGYVGDHKNLNEAGVNSKIQESITKRGTLFTEVNYLAWLAFGRHVLPLVHALSEKEVETFRRVWSSDVILTSELTLEKQREIEGILDFANNPVMQGYKLC